MVKPTWEDRDLPVLRAAVELIEESDRASATAEAIQDRTGFDEATVQGALRALRSASPSFFGTFVGVGSLAVRSGHVTQVVREPTERARAVVGLWPTGEAMADRVVAAFERAAEEAESDDERGKLRQLASGIGSVGRGVLVDVMAKIVAKSTGLEP